MNKTKLVVIHLTTENNWEVILAFIKNTIFSAKWNSAFKNKSITSYITTAEYGDNGMVKGNTIKVSAISGITVQDYVVGTEISYDSLATTEIEVLMDKQKGVFVIVEDIDEVQTNLDVMNEVVYDGTNKLVKQVDTDVLAQLTADAITNTDIIEYVNTGLTRDNVLDELLIPARTALNSVDAPDEGRYLVVDPATEALIQGADLTLSDAGLEKNLIGRTMGISIYWSNDLPTGKMLAGVKEASAFGASLSKVKTGASEAQVGDFLQIIEVYGSKVLKRAVFSISQAA